MDAGQYYITTLTNAAMKLGPLIFYVVAGYFLFIKLPFLLYYRTLQKPKSFTVDETPPMDQDFQKKMEEERRKEFEERMKNLGSKQKEQKAEEKQSFKQESKKEEFKHQKNEKKAYSSQEQKKRPESQRPSEAIKASPEEILFKLKPGQVFTAQELKKRYHQLLQENHPDKFRTDHQKEHAEAKTKSINEAYQKLKKRVS